MKANFVKRLGAFIIDTFLLSIIFSLIAVGFSDNSSATLEEITNALEEYENNEITIEEYNDKILELNYDLQKKTVLSNTLEVVLYIGYFVVFSYLNKGQTLGKQICKIKVVRIDGDVPGIWNMVVRSLFIYGIFTLLFSVVFVNILDTIIFTYGYYVAVYIEFFFMIISFFMVLYKKEGRGLHDIMARTKVIEEVK